MFGHSVLNPMSPQALAISNLFVFLLIAAGANLLGLVGTLAITLDERAVHHPGHRLRRHGLYHDPLPAG